MRNDRGPLIGLTLPKKLSLVSAYRHALEAAGARIAVLSFGAGAFGNPSVRSLDGILFSGGGDIHAKFYGEDLSPLSADMDVERDEYELCLAREAIGLGVPVFGICRGVQLLNVAMGGTLYQDVREDCPGRAMRHQFEKHSQDRFHPVQIETGTWLNAACGQERVTVNSHHHQAICDLGSGLVVSARAPDDVVEAVEGDSVDTFAAGVQWHPELLAPEDQWPIREFVQVCGSR